MIQRLEWGYHSDPTKTYSPKSMGKFEEVDNSRLFREIKHVIANYKTIVSSKLDPPGNLQVLTRIIDLKW